MKKSVSRKNKERRRRKARIALLKRNEGLGVFDLDMQPLTREERRNMYRWAKGKITRRFYQNLDEKLRGTEC